MSSYYSPRSALSALLVAIVGPTANAQTQANPPGSGPLLSAAEWIQGTLLGNVATTIAVIAIAIVGFMMLSGRLNWRHGATVIVGCFVLFGAVGIVAGIQTAAS